MDVVVIGAGLTGLSTGYHLKNDYVVFESLAEPGGMAGSYKRDGFTFDHGGVHVLRTNDNYLRGSAKAYYNKFLKQLLQDNINKKEKRAFIYLQGNYHLRPFQHNLHGASPEVIEECAAGVAKIKRKIVFADDKELKTSTFANFKEELLEMFGEGLCKYFMFPYNEKAWCHDLTTMKSKIWISKNFGTIFDISKFEEGVALPNEVEKTFVRYPKVGGFGATGKSLYHLVAENVKLNSKLTKVDFEAKEIEINGSEKYNYNHLVSTIPMPELIKAIPDAPAEVKQAAEALKYTAMLCINIGVDRENISEMQYIYYPEKDISFTRVSFPVNQSDKTVPAGKTGVCVEVPYSKEQPIADKEKMVEDVMKDLVKVGVLKEDDTILFKDVKDMKYSYVVQDLELEKNMKILQKFLLKYNIHSVGRYGEWKHSGTEHAIDDGKKIARKLRFDR